MTVHQEKEDIDNKTVKLLDDTIREDIYQII